MHIKVKAITGHHGELSFNGQTYPCAIGKSGITKDKIEGDHASPAGLYPLKTLYYRADKLDCPDTVLSCKEITRNDGWCDDPTNLAYNKPVSLPFSASHEALWRDDNLYDLIIALGHNDNPPIPGKGSCIFIHIAKDLYDGTEGCIALNKQDFLKVLLNIKPDTQIEIEP